MVILLVILAMIALVVGFFTLSQATMGVAHPSSLSLTWSLKSSAPTPTRSSCPSSV
jgi:hypothetical protein